MNHEKNWSHEMTPEEEKKINDKVVEQGISDMPRSEPLEMIKKLSLEVTKFKSENPELAKEVAKTFLDNELKNVSPEIKKLQYKSEKLFILMEKVESDLKEYFGDGGTNNAQISFKNALDESKYKELKREKNNLEYEMKEIGMKIKELTKHQLN